MEKCQKGKASGPLHRSEGVVIGLQNGCYCVHTHIGMVCLESFENQTVAIKMVLTFISN